MATRYRLFGKIVTARDTVPEDSIAKDFEVFGSIGSGAFSDVLQCQRRETGEIFACKKLNKSFKNWDDPREVGTALRLPIHPNIVRLFEVHFGKSPGKVSLLYEKMDSDLLILTREVALPHEKISSVMFQILSGLAHLHGNGIMHCDLKPDNILIKKPDYTVKLGDFGNAQLMDKVLPRTQHYACTRWYRPPECILTNGYYGQEMDIWAAGCIFYELMKHEVLFRGWDEMDQYNVIESIIGPPPPNIVQQYSNYILGRGKRVGRNTSPAKRQRTSGIQNLLLELQEYQHPLSGGTYLESTDDPDNVLNTIENLEAKSLLLDFLQYDPQLRPTAEASLLHGYLKKVDPEE